MAVIVAVAVVAVVAVLVLVAVIVCGSGRSSGFMPLALACASRLSSCGSRRCGSGLCAHRRSGFRRSPFVPTECCVGSMSVLCRFSVGSIEHEKYRQSNSTHDVRLVLTKNRFTV